MITTDNCAFVLVDVQERLLGAMHDRDRLIDQTRRLLSGMAALKVPVLCTEQVPEKLGPTMPDLASLMPGSEPIPKSSFSCMGEGAFVRRLRDLGREAILLAGIETHVCVYQTARDLLAAGYRVDLVADAVSSRTPSNLEVGTRRMLAEGVRLTSVEMCLFELQRVAGDDTFRTISRIIR